MASLSPKTKISLVNMLGGLTLAGMVGYFFALGRALLGSDAQWSEFFASNVLWFLYVPFTLGLVYFFARVQLGRSLLEQGALDEVIAWTTPRLRYSFWMRGKREVLIQRVVLAQAHMGRLDFEKAREVLWLKESLPAKARELLELYAWRVTWALRHEDLVLTMESLEKGRELQKPAPQRAALLALDAMRELRAHHYAQVRELLDESRWLAPTWQADLVCALWASEDRMAKDVYEGVLKGHESLNAQLQDVLPGALPEYLLAVAQLMGNEGSSDEAMALKVEARDLVSRGLADPRSVWVVGQSKVIQEEE